MVEGAISGAWSLAVEYGLEVMEVAKSKVDVLGVAGSGSRSDGL